MYNHILVAIAPRQERPAQKALEVASELCGPGGRIVALHVVEEVSAYFQGYLSEHHGREASAAALVALSETIAGLENVQPVVVIGHAARTILDYADANGIDCVIVASHRPEVSDYLLGSTAARVVRHAPCAVHVVR